MPQYLLYVDSRSKTFLLERNGICLILDLSRYMSPFIQKVGLARKGINAISEMQSNILTKQHCMCLFEEKECHLIMVAFQANKITIQSDNITTANQISIGYTFSYLLIHLVDTISYIILMFIRKKRTTFQFLKIFGVSQQHKKLLRTQLFQPECIKIQIDSESYTWIINIPPRNCLLNWRLNTVQLVQIGEGGIKQWWIYPSLIMEENSTYVTILSMGFCLDSGRITKWCHSYPLYHWSVMEQLRDSVWVKMSCPHDLRHCKHSINTWYR